MDAEPKSSNLWHFTEKGYRPRGVVHVGANDGEEIQWYLNHGCQPVLCFEPHPAAVERARTAYGGLPNVAFIQCALGAEDDHVGFHIPSDGDDEKTSRYLPIPTEGHDWTKVATGSEVIVPVVRFDGWCARNRVDLTAYNALVIDAQGMELEVLEGFGERLRYFDFLCIELSATPVYDGEASAETVSQWLASRGYVRDSEIREHDDVLFVARHVAR